MKKIIFFIFFCNIYFSQNKDSCEKGKYIFIGKSDVANNYIYLKELVNVSNGNPREDLLGGSIFLKEEFKTGIKNTSAFSVFCGQGRMDFTSQISFDKNGKLKGKTTKSEVITDIYPGTLLEYVFNYTCKCAKNNTIKC